MASPRIALLVNDSYFAHRVASGVLDEHGDDVALVILSNRTTGSAKRIGSVFRKASVRYFAYRSLLQVAGWLPKGRRRTVRRRARGMGIPTLESSDVNADANLIRNSGASLGIAVNFDQILRGETLENFSHGVINFHASRLPDDRGISPALWAFARGDEEIWYSIYRMDEGLDTGPLYEQASVAVEPGETAFSMYGRVCDVGGQETARVTRAVLDDGLEPRTQTGDPSEAHSWPDKEFARMLRENRRRLIRFGEALRLFF
jgi:folate-dependent phosphoribosylglycinamide formyltransferase PurN